MLAKVHSFVLQGIEAVKCEVEVNIAAKEYGEPLLVGLPDNAVKAALDRIRTAMINSGFRFPDTQLLVNLAPADIKKEGSALELPIALGILQAGKPANFCVHTFGAIAAWCSLGSYIDLRPRFSEARIWQYQR